MEILKAIILFLALCGTMGSLITMFNILGAGEGEETTGDIVTRYVTMFLWALFYYLS